MRRPTGSAGSSGSPGSGSGVGVGSKAGASGKVGTGGGRPVTSGSGRNAKVTPVRPGAPGAVNRTRRLAVLATVVALMAVFVAPTVHAYLAQRSQIDQLRQQVASQERDVSSLQKQQQLWADDQYVIQQARQRLKFVKVGEKSYTVIDGDSSKDDIGLASAPASSDDHPWYGRLWESVGVADAPAAHP